MKRHALIQLAVHAFVGWLFGFFTVMSWLMDGEADIRLAATIAVYFWFFLCPGGLLIEVGKREEL